MPLSQEECLTALGEVADELGHPPSMPEYEAQNRSPCAPIISDRCGGWDAALAKLQDDVDYGADYSQQDCIDALQTAAAELDEKLTVYAYTRRDQPPEVQTIVDVFGSWENAKEAAGLTE